MSTVDVRAQLTAPGGPFEVIHEVVDGVEMKVYKDRLPDLRTVAQIGMAHGDKEFIVHGDRRITFTEFLRSANSVSAGLAEGGVGPGDRVAVLSQNNPEWCLTFWATVNLGAVLVGLNGWWNEDEITYGLQDSGARVLVADRKRFERLRADVDRIDSLELVFLIDAVPADFPGPDGSPSPKLRAFNELTTEPTDRFPDVPLREDDHAVIFYTSGTTGRPKGAISSHRNMIANLQNTVFLLTLGAMTTPGGGGGGGQPVSLFTSPLFHVSGCHSGLVVGMLAGMRMVMIDGRFTPDKAFELIQQEGVMIWATVPTMIWRACEHPDRHQYDTSSVISVSFGGSPSADELQRRIRETFPNVKATTNAYGLTESSSVATTLSGAESLSKADSVGLPTPVVDLAIMDTDGSHLPPGRTGEVLIRGPIIMPGYWNKPEATAETVIDGWLHTGDVGHLDEDGFLFITDRAKDMLIRGGENVYCVEIENRLVQHPEIADAAVVGVPHHELGEEVKAVVEVMDGSSITDADIRSWVAETLAPFKVPAHIERWGGKLPRNASGKLLKNVLRGEGHVSFAETM